MDTIRLTSGRQIRIRPIGAGDAERLQEAYARLTPETRYRRFLAVKPQLTSGDIRYLTTVDGRDHVALVALDPDDPERILGVARFVRLVEDPESAELAIVVGDPFQGEGVGSALVSRLAEAALDRGVSRFTATMLAENTAAHRLVHRLGAAHASERHAGPVTELVVELA